MILTRGTAKKEDTSMDDLVEKMVKSYGYKQTVEMLAKKAGYERMPPTIEEFFSNPDYLGDAFKLYPEWKRALSQIYPNQFTSPYLEIGLTGAIGLGKTTVALTGNLYDALKLLFLRSPQEYCMLSTPTVIAFAMINATATLAKSVLIDQLEEYVAASPVLREFRAKSKKARLPTYFSKRIDFVAGSRFTHVLGRAIVGGVLSELNFQASVADQAVKNHSSVMIRLRTRFEKTYMLKGSYPGRVWIDTSKNDANSFVENYLNHNAQNPLLRVFDYAFWEIHKKSEDHPHGFPYSGSTFKVFIGSSVRDPCIIEHSSDIIGMPEELIIDVPVEHEGEFRTNLPLALRDRAGKGTWSTSKLISSVESLSAALEFPNPVLREEVTVDFWDHSEKLIDFMDLRLIKKDARPWHIHIDIALTKDRAGIAATRFDGWTEFERMNSETLKVERVRYPLFRTDWVMSIKAKPSQEIPLAKFEELVYALRDRGYAISHISTDGYQSRYLRQNFMRNGYATSEISSDRTKDPYNTLKNCILEKRWVGPRQNILKDELANLIDFGKKFDHDATHSKDVSDAVACSLTAALNAVDDDHAAAQFTDYMDVMTQELENMNLYQKILSQGL